ncbi:MAG: CpsD/CapB family tyrosine-protein kinase [Clostridiales bacterium]|jgi:capsular exopolysaccharide synthesis family protein|nr:CpsD/CapB family tyrosine-protein kinase [Clostridiales bacterium]
MKNIQLKRFDKLDYAGNEAINTLCTNLSFAGSDVRRIMFTSAHEGEGKSFLAMQVMRTLGKMGKSVVLVDADLRRSVLTGRYGMQVDGEAEGLAHYLAGLCEMESVVYRTNLPGACLIPIGRDVANPLPLLNSNRFPILLDYLARMFDAVLVDSPPVGLVIDAAQIAKHCDGVLFTVEFNGTRRHELKEARHQIEQSGCPILGCVINKVSFDSYSAKRYYNRTYYSHYNSEYHRRAGKAAAASRKK